MRAEAEFWNTVGRLARWIGDRFRWLSGKLYWWSGDFDARADTAGYWNWHKPTSYPTKPVPGSMQGDWAPDGYEPGWICADTKGIIRWRGHNEAEALKRAAQNDWRVVREVR